MAPEAGLDRAEAFILSDSSYPYRGFIDARIWFDGEAFLDAFEFVDIDRAGRPRRRKYSYHLSVDSNDVERHDYDPQLEDPALRHHVNRIIRGQWIHIPSERISLIKMVERCWGLIAEERDLVGEDDAPG